MTKGLDAILANLTKLQVQAPKAAREAVTEAAEAFGNQLSANTPSQYGDLKEDVTVTGFKGANEGLVSKDIGYGKETGWRADFPNEGTIYQEGQEFKENTIAQMTPIVKEIYAKKVKEVLNL